jgi:hypothetical protein
MAVFNDEGSARPNRRTLTGHKRHDAVVRAEFLRRQVAADVPTLIVVEAHERIFSENRAHADGSPDATYSVNGLVLKSGVKRTLRARSLGAARRARPLARKLRRLSSCARYLKRARLIELPMAS